MPVIDEITSAIQQGQSLSSEFGWKRELRKLFGDRYHDRFWDEDGARDAYSLGNGDKKDSVPFAGFISPSNPTSGAYGGLSLCWFPSKEHGSLIAFVVGTAGLSPDEGILARPGHRRRIAALRRYLVNRGVHAWSKSDPSNLNDDVPETVKRELAPFDNVLKRYGNYLYCIAAIDPSTQNAVQIVQAFFDLYAIERKWLPKQEAKGEFARFSGLLHADIFPRVTANDIHHLLKQRRFVILQGPPGTGKSRISKEIRDGFFGGKGKTIQFHPAVTYEDFVVGLAPEPDAQGLRFRTREGWLLTAAREAQDTPYVLCIDEINRADLGKILGEAIYLFEPEPHESSERVVSLPHAIDGISEFKLPQNLYVLGTMNTADRSIAPLDLAIRRRFAFVSMYPDRDVVKQTGIQWALNTFDEIQEVFVEHVPDESLELLPGHAYYLARTEDQLRNRFRYQLLPLLDEYLQQGLIAQAASDLQAVRDRLEDRVRLGIN